MFYVYVIRSFSFPDQIYIGYTSDLKQRLLNHNSGKSPHTSKFKPWELITFTGFNNAEKALEFENYLKSSSGRNFIKKRLM